MEDHLLFSIITVCYNAEKIIGGTIESVLQQSWPHFEYIIVDGASTDGTVRRIENYSKGDKRVRLYSEPDSGIYNAMNKGIRHAKGRFLYFLNAGDTFHSDTVLAEVAKVIMSSQADLIIGNIVLKAGSRLTEKFYALGEKLTELLQSGDSVCHQAIFASAVSLAEGFDERFKICADYNWLCRQVNRQRKLAKAEVFIVDYDTQGMSNQMYYQKLHWNESYEVVRENFPECNTKELAKIQKLYIQGLKRYYLYELMNRWVILKQKQADLRTFFVRQGIFEIAIYGMHYMGQRLLDELEGSAVRVKYVVDQKALAQDGKYVVRHPSDALEPVEAIVITPIFDYIEIREGILQKLDCKIFSIKDVLYYEY